MFYLLLQNSLATLRTWWMNLDFHAKKVLDLEEGNSSDIPVVILF